MSYFTALDLAGSYIHDVVTCDDCGRPRDLSRCPCTYELPEAVKAPAERRYAVLLTDGSHAIPYLSEMMARSFAAGNGGSVTCDGDVIAFYPVPERRIEIYRQASRAAALIIQGRDRGRRAA